MQAEDDITIDIRQGNTQQATPLDTCSRVRHLFEKTTQWRPFARHAQAAQLPGVDAAPSGEHAQGTVAKRSFYQMLGIAPGASRGRIDAAYAAMSARLNVKEELHSASQAVTEQHLLREGYRILSNPDLRAAYDAKLAAAQSGVRAPLDTGRTGQLRLALATVGALTLLLGGVAYSQLTCKMADVKAEYQLMRAKSREDLSRPILMNAAPQGELSCSYR